MDTCLRFCIYCAGAFSKMQPDQAKFLLDFLLPRLKSEQAITKKILSAVPPDKGDYKPHPKCMSSLKLSRHLAATEMWFLDAVIGHVFNEDDSPMPSELNLALR